MRLEDEVRKLVVFLGFRTINDDGVSVLKYGGTGFFVTLLATPDLPEIRFPYLVTARHVANNLAGPFALSFNGHDGNPYVIDVDKANWSFHPDENVDVAVIKLDIDDNRWLTFACEMFADNEDSALFSKFGAGDLVYIVGLYRLFPGQAKISPVVHTGHVAMTPDEEIPIKNTTTGQEVSTRGYLIEAQTLKGLSGSPVFVCYTNATGVHYDPIMAYTKRVYLLGLWQGAWDDIAGKILTEEIGRDRRVPVGMGITVPARRIMETLKIPELEQQRSDWIEQYRNKGAATMDCG